MKSGSGIVKGTPSGLVISLALHAGAVLLAGTLIVFTTRNKPGPFVVPEVREPPKIDLLKPQVRVPKNVKPQASAPITTEVKEAAMPELQIPDLPGKEPGSVLTGSFFTPTSFSLTDNVNPFGLPDSIGNDLEGTLYDFKRFHDGSRNNAYDLQTCVEKFIRSGWKPGSISQYYKSPNKLYTPTIMIPPTESTLGPWAFGEPDMDPWAYMLHYKGQLVNRENIKFRFVAMADNYLVIRVNGKVVLDYKNQFEAAIPGKPFKPLSYHLGHWYAYASDWIELDAGVPQNVEFIMGEYSGVLFASMVAVEVYGEDYPSAPMPQDNPQLPIFKTAALSIDQIDTVYEGLWEDHLQVTTGPVFCDMGSVQCATNSALSRIVTPSPFPIVTPSEASALRIWTLKNEKRFEAEFVNMFSGKAVLKTTDGKWVKISLSDFSDDDRGQIERLNPPKLKLSFKKNASQLAVRSNPDMISAIPVATEFAGGVVIQQQDLNNDYRCPLRLEFYVISDEFDGENYILHDRQTAEFTLTAENDHRFELTGRKDIMMRYEHYSGKVRGEKYKGYMILVLDEQGRIVAQNLSHDWLLDIRDELYAFPVGRHFNKEGRRVSPPRPLFTDKYWDHEA